MRVVFSWKLAVWGVLGLAVSWGLVGCGGKAEPVAGGRVKIETTPVSGVDIVLNGVIIGQTPTWLEGYPAGTVLLQAKRDGYRSVSRMVEIPEEGEQSVTLKMDLMVGYVTLGSEPTPAKVFLDGLTEIGETPLHSAPVPIGNHRFEVRLDKYDSAFQDVAIEEDFRYTYTLRLEPKLAKLEIASSPSSASIWLNDEAQAQTTPANLSILPGLYRVAVHRPGYVMAEQVVELGPQDDKHIELTMEKGDTPIGMVLVSSGEFTFGLNGGSPDERPQHAVNVPAFYIDRYEVTNRQFKAVYPEHKYPGPEDNYPVSGVSFKQAAAYAAAVGKRLPTEMEWEKAARGTDGRVYPWGVEFRVGMCNAVQKRKATLMEVGQFRGGASPYGCQDMAGNALEWTTGWYEAYPGNQELRQDYGQVFRVLRGGYFGSSEFDVRVVRRFYDRMDASEPHYGFRCAKDVEQK